MDDLKKFEGERQCAATPHKDLIAQIMDSRIPKNEREHAAAREIATLRTQLADREELLEEAKIVIIAHAPGHEVTQKIRKALEETNAPKLGTGGE